MAYVPGFTGDVFISYCHQDNDDEWVTDLKSIIATRLSDLAKAEVWFDLEKLRIGDRLNEIIDEKLRNTLVLVAVISPRYLLSLFCMENEYETFLNRNGRSPCQLQKGPLTPGTAPPQKGVLIHQKLFHEETGVPFSGSRLTKELNKSIACIRKRMEEARTTCAKIYLAQTKNPNFMSVRKELEDALHESGYAVLPDEIVVERTENHRIDKWLGDSELSIHFPLDRDYLAAKQFERAGRISKPRMTLTDNQFGREHIPGIIENIKSELSKITRRDELYLIYEYDSDKEQVEQLAAEIEIASNKKVALSWQGETYHHAKLRHCAGVIIFRQATASRSWLEYQKESIRKIRALRSGQFLPEACYSIQPGEPQGVAIRKDHREVWSIDRVGTPNISDLQRFFDELTPTASAVAAGG